MFSFGRLVRRRIDMPPLRADEILIPFAASVDNRFTAEVFIFIDVLISLEG